MQIKSLLLGSAAALAAVTGARAADAPVTMVEPEPVEYVRVCDVYGTGFFYIPGTETCLKVGGYVRFRVGADSDSEDGRGFTNRFNTTIDTNGDGIADRTVGNNNNEDYRAGFVSRGHIDFDAREETELGTLRGKVALEADSSSSLGAFSTNLGATNEVAGLKEAYIQLGGLTVGLLDSVWTAEDGGITDGLLTDNDWAAGDNRQNRISYTFAANGFSGTVSLEDDGDGDWRPDVIGKLAYKAAWGGAYLLGVYDEDSSNAFGARFGTLNGTFAADGRNPAQTFVNTTGVYRYGTDEGGSEDGAFVLKGGVQLQDLLTAGSIFKVEGHYAFDPSIYATVGNASFGNLALSTVGFPTFTNSVLTGFSGTAVPFSVANTGTLSSRYQVGAAYQQNFDKLRVAVSGIYGETFDLNATYTNFVIPAGTTVPSFTAPGTQTRVLDLGSANYWGVAGDVGYAVTKNLDVLGEVSYRKIDMPAGVDDYDQTSGFLQLKRSF